jgi:hypothetical protein
MPTYEIQAPNGRTYQITGPSGASDDEVRAQVLQQYPDAASSAPTQVNPATLGEIRHEPGFIESLANTARRETLPTLGLVAGGVLGTPLGPVGSVSGAGLGYALGKQANRVGSAIMDYLYPNQGWATPSALETAKDIGMDVVRGGTMEAGGQSIGAAAGKVADILRASGVPGFGSNAAADLAVQQAAQRQEIQLPASAATGSRPLAQLEATPARFPIGAAQAREFYDRTALSAQRAAERLAQSSGPADRETLGSAIQQSLDAAQAEARARVDPMFNAMRTEATSVGTGVPLTRTAEVAQQVAEVEARMGALGRAAVQRRAGTLADLAGAEGLPAQLAQLPSSLQEQLIAQYGLDQAASVAPRDVLELQSRLNAAVRAAPDDVSRRAVAQLRDAISQDLNDWATGAGANVGDLRAQAAEAYKTQIVPYFTEKAPLRRTLMDVTSDKAATSLLRMNDPALVRDAMQFISPEVQDRVRAATLEDLVTRSFDPTSQRFSTARFMTERARIPDEIWQRLLTEDQAGAMRDLGVTFRRINDYARGAANPSGTAQALMAAGQTYKIGHALYSLLTNPIGAVGELATAGAPAWGGKLLYSDPLQRFLTRQPQAPITMDALSRLLGIGAVRGGAAILPQAE